MHIYLLNVYKRRCDESSPLRIGKIHLAGENPRRCSAQLDIDDFLILCCPLAAKMSRCRVYVTAAEVTAGNMAAPNKAAVVLKAVKRIAVQFSPFEPNVRSTRYESLFSLAGIVSVVLRLRHKPQ